MEHLKYGFEGYYRVKDRALPCESGIYVLYEGIPGKDNQVILGKILYAGQAEDFSNRVDDHIGEWTLTGNSELYATLAEFDKEDLDWAEAALVFALQPEHNKYLKDEYKHEDTTIYLTGERKGMEPKYVLYKGARA